MSNVLMVALVSHITSAGMVTPGDEFEVPESEAKAYEKRTRRPLAERVEAESADDDADADAEAPSGKKTAAKGKSGRKSKAKDAEKDSADSGNDDG